MCLDITEKLICKWSFLIDTYLLFKLTFLPLSSKIFIAFGEVLLLLTLNEHAHYKRELGCSTKWHTQNVSMLRKMETFLFLFTYTYALPVAVATAA